MNILLIGLGSIAKKHILALRCLDIDLKIYALRSKRNASIEEGIENIFDLEDFDTSSLDFAIISNPTYLHFYYIEKLTELRVNLFIEKPAIHELKSSDNLVELVRKKQITTYVACNLRFHPCIVYLYDTLKNIEFRINEVNVYCGSYLPDWRLEKNYRDTYSAISSMGGGVHLDLFHELDYTVWLFGLPKETKTFLRSNSSLNIESMDYANYTLGYEGFTVNIIMNYYRREPKREIEIVFENETWIVDLLNSQIKKATGEPIFKQKNFDINETYRNQLQYYINCLRSSEAPMNSLSESIQILKICLENA